MCNRSLLPLALASCVAAAAPQSGQLVADASNPRWLRIEGGGPFFLAGPGDPEDFLYRGTRNADGTRTGDQQSIVQKLAGTGANSLYLEVVRSHGGDGPSSHNPFVDSDPAKGLSAPILDQWESWFTAMDAAGIVIFLFIYDDGARIWSGDGVGAEEAAFLQALVARFKHHRLLVWCVAEEYQEAYSAARVKAIAATLRAADDHQHPIAVHKLSGLSFAELAGDPNIDQFAIQYNVPTAAQLHQGMVSAWAGASGTYNLNMSEAANHGTGEVARKKDWAVALGGAYVMRLGMDVANTAASDLADMGRLVSFFSKAPFDEMAPHDELAREGTEYVLAFPGSSYIAYASSGSGALGLAGLAAGTYELSWLDAQTGTTVVQTGLALPEGDASWPRPAGIGAEAAVLVRRTQSAGNAAPTAHAADVATKQDTPVDLTLAYVDPDGPGPYVVSIVSPPAHGLLGGSGQARTYTPAPGFVGADSFTFAVSDGLAVSAPAAVRLQVVSSQNAAPVAKDQSLSTAMGEPVQVSLAYDDPDGPGPYEVTVLEAPRHGTLSGVGNDRTYAPEPGFTGTDSYRWRVHDGLASSSAATVSITVGPPSSPGGKGGGTGGEAVWAGCAAGGGPPMLAAGLFALWLLGAGLGRRQWPRPHRFWGPAFSLCTREDMAVAPVGRPHQADIATPARRPISLGEAVGAISAQRPCMRTNWTRSWGLVVAVLSFCFGCRDPGLMVVNREEPPPEESPAEATSAFPVSVVLGRGGERYIQPKLFGLNVPANSARDKTSFYAQYGNGATVGARAADGKARLQSMGFRYLRFPGGCPVDGWDWRNSLLRFRYNGSNIVTTPVISLQEIREVASELGASTLFQVNIDVRGEPNACGWQSEYPLEGTSREQRLATLLDDARELARTLQSGDVELGNEQWGTWPTEDYAQVALTFARAMKEVSPSLQIYLAGHASTGSNTQPGQDEGPKDMEWTAMVQRLLADTSCTASKTRCFAGATDHPYGEAGYHPFLDHLEKNFRGMSAYLPVLNGWIFDQRVADYGPRNLAVSEWNIRCWTQGNQGIELVRVTNPGFETGNEGWPFSQLHDNTGSRALVSTPVQGGAQAMKVMLSSSSGQAVDHAQVAQTFQREPGRVLEARVFLHSARPEYARLVLEQANAGAHQGAVIAQASGAGLAANQWKPLSVTGTTFEDTTVVRLVLRVEKSVADWQADPAAASVVFDSVKLVDSTFGISLENESFESGKPPWAFWQRNPGTGSWSLVALDARDGTHKARLDMTAASGAGLDTVQVSQAFGARPGRNYRATAYVKTATPGYGRLILQQRNAGAHQWHHLAETSLGTIKAGVWQGVMVTGASFDDTTEVQVVVRLEKTASDWSQDPAAASLSFDLVHASDVTTLRPPVASVQTAEHGLFALTSSLEMARAGVFSSTYHCAGNNTCGVVQDADGGVDISPAAQGLRFTSPLAGGRMLDATATGPTWVLPPSPCDKAACLPGEVSAPYVSSYAAYGPGDDGEGRHNSLLVFLVNRHGSRPAQATVDTSALGAMPGLRLLQASTLSAAAYTDHAMTEAQGPAARVTATSPLTVEVPAKGAVRLSLSFERLYGLTLRATCADGSVSTQVVQGFWALWPSPAGGLDWQQTAASAGEKVLQVASHHVWNNLYVGLTDPSGQALVPRTPLPRASMTAGRWFNPSTWMVNVEAVITPDGSYVLDFAATSGCP